MIETTSNFFIVQKDLPAEYTKKSDSKTKRSKTQAESESDEEEAEDLVQDSAFYSAVNTALPTPLNHRSGAGHARMSEYTNMDAESLVKRIANTTYVETSGRKEESSKKKFLMQKATVFAGRRCGVAGCSCPPVHPTTPIDELCDCDEDFCADHENNHDCPDVDKVAAIKDAKRVASSSSSSSSSSFSSTKKRDPNLCQVRDRSNKYMCREVASGECPEMACGLVYCADHFRPEDHSCDGLQDYLERKEEEDKAEREKYSTQQQSEACCELAGCLVQYMSKCHQCQKSFCSDHEDATAHGCNKDNPIICLSCEKNAVKGCSACGSYFCAKHSQQAKHKCLYCRKCVEENVYEENGFGPLPTLASCDCSGMFCEHHIGKDVHSCSKLSSSVATTSVPSKKSKPAAAMIVEISTDVTSGGDITRIYCFKCGYGIHVGSQCPIMVHGDDSDAYTRNMKNAKSHFDKCFTKKGGKDVYGSTKNY